MRRSSRLLISVHVPKTAGSSLQETLSNHYRSRLLRFDQDRPANIDTCTRRSLRTKPIGGEAGNLEQVDCVHGHLLGARWRTAGGVRPVEFVTWLRDPVERLASHFEYWKRVYDPSVAQPFHRRVVEEGWSFEEFALCGELRNLASEMIDDIPPERFAFVGVTERFEEDHATFCEAVLGSPHRVKVSNVGPSGINNRHVHEGSLRKRIETFHSRDVALHQSVLNTGKLPIGGSAAKRP